MIANLTLALILAATCPMHEEHMKAAAATAKGDAKHGAEVDMRHDALVESHESTRHAFRLFPDGGAIELRANDAGDVKTIDGVRAHIKNIASQFEKKDFSTPAFVHGRPPAGIAEMERRFDAIAFQYEEVDRGGRIRMTTQNGEALAAIHDFMKFQVTEHRTGDTGKVEADR